MLYTIEIYKRDARRRSGEVLNDKRDVECADLHEATEVAVAMLKNLSFAGTGRYSIHETMVERVNALTGEKFMERYDRPYYCSPSSETYWSS